MEIACVIVCRLAAPQRPGRSGGPRPGREMAADPVGVGELGEAMVRGLEGIGAGVEMGRVGEMFFSVGGLRGLYGGEVAGVTAAARRAVEMACGVTGAGRGQSPEGPWGTGANAGRSVGVTPGDGAAWEAAGMADGPVDREGVTSRAGDHAGGAGHADGREGMPGDHAAKARHPADCEAWMPGRAVGHGGKGRDEADREGATTRPGFGHTTKGRRPTDREEVTRTTFDRGGGGKTTRMPGGAVGHASGEGHPDGPDEVTTRMTFDHAGGAGGGADARGVTTPTAGMTFGHAAGARRSPVVSGGAGEALRQTAGVSGEAGRALRRSPGVSGGALRGSVVLIGVGPTRTAARAAAELGLPPVTPPRLAGFLGSLPTGVLIDRLGEGRRGEELVASLERLGIGTLGALRRLSNDQVADRFGPLGLRALGIARGEEAPLRPRIPHEDLVEEIELPEGIAGSQLDQALELLVDRLLAAPGRKGRTLLGVRLGAQLCGGGSWSVDQGLGRPSAAAGVLRRLLVPRLVDLPGPAEALRLRALGFGPPAADQLVMEVGGSEPRRRRLGAAVREVRAAQGADALLRVLPVDAASRVPERRHLLTPFPEV